MCVDDVYAYACVLMTCCVRICVDDVCAYACVLMTCVRMHMC